MSPPTIRPATAADIPAIAAIYGHAVVHGTASFEIEPPTEAEMSRRQQSLLDAGYPYLVAEIADQVAGYAYAGPYRTRPAYAWSVEDSIYVGPASQGHRVGRALLGQLIAECEKRGYRQMVAVIGDSAQAPSIALHRAAGFRLIGTIENVGFKHGRWLDSVLMQRALGPGANGSPDTHSGLGTPSSAPR